MGRNVVLVLLILMCSISCDRRSNSKVLNGEAGRKLREYIVDRDTSSLSAAYRLLRADSQFGKQGISDENQDFVVSLLMYMKKYNELEELLVRSKVATRESEVTLNLVRALKVYQTDSVASLRYIDLNLSQFRHEMNINGSDSVLYCNYFVMLLYKNGRNATLQSIDSFKRIDRRFSREFHDYVLRDWIEEYPEEFLFPRRSGI